MTHVGRNPGRIIPHVLRGFADQHRDRRVRIIGEPIWPGRTAAEYPACVSHEALINTALAGRAVTVLCPYNLAVGRAVRVGIAPARVADVAVAVSELATNSIEHGGGAGTLRVWADHRHLICEVSDAGYLTDPMAGRRPVAPENLSGRGLLLVNLLASLTDQERRILEFVAEGLTNREIAGRMFLAEKTVKNYVSSLLAKPGLERRTQAAVLATKLLGDRRR